MKIFRLIFTSIFSLLFQSATPNLFGSRKRRKALDKLSKKIGGWANDVDTQIEELQSQNPFESAAAKSAMTQSARNAKQIQARYANMLGANASPEAMIASQQATQEVVGGTAGDIATGAEALKAQQMSNLQQQKMAYRQMQTGAKTESINQIGKGWTDFFGSIGQIGQAVSGIGEGASKIAGLF